MSQPLFWEISAFCAVVEKRSFVDAARKLGRSPSTVTRAIQSLESNLGKVLLQRSQKEVCPTAAGESYYSYAKQVLALQQAAEDEMAGANNVPRGWIRFSAPEIMSMTFLPSVIDSFNRSYPEVRLDVRFTDDTVDPIREQLDFTIRGGFPQDSELIGYTLWDYKRHLYASPSYIRAGNKLPLSPQDLDQHKLILHTAPRILKDWHLVSDTSLYKCKPSPLYRFNSGIAIYHAIISGLGIGRLADWVGEPLVQSGQLIRACPTWRICSPTGQDAQMHVVYTAGHHPKRVRLFLEMMRQMAKSRAICC